MNPQSGNRGAMKQWHKLEPSIDALIGDYAVFHTDGPGHATLLTRDALKEGYTRIVSVGGDGTAYEVVNGFFEDDIPINPDASMTILPIGTACDLRKTLRLPKPAESVSYLVDPYPVRMDVGKVVSTDSKGKPVTNYFLTAVHIGVGGLTGVYVNRRSKRLGGFASFLVGVITARLVYKCPVKTVEFAGTIDERPMLEVIVANGQFDGGGMTVAPNCKLDNGQFELYNIGKMSVLGTILNLPKIYSGTIDTHPKVEYHRVNQVKVETSSAVWISPDGEVSGQTPATVEILPKVLNMVMGPNPPIE